MFSSSKTLRGTHASFLTDWRSASRSDKGEQGGGGGGGGGVAAGVEGGGAGIGGNDFFHHRKSESFESATSSSSLHLSGGSSSSSASFSPAMAPSSHPSPPSFNDITTSDIRIEILDRNGEIHSALNLHAEILREQSEFFFAALTRKGSSGREPAPGLDHGHTTMALKANEFVTDLDAYISTFRLFYQEEDMVPEEIQGMGSVWKVLDVLLVSSELQFHSCTSTCVEYLESVPWNDDEQSEILRLFSILKIDDARHILDRLPVRTWDEETISDSLRMLLIRAVSFHDEVPGVDECRESAAAILRNRHAPVLTLKGKKQVLRETFVDLLQCLWSEQQKKSFRRAATTQRRQRPPLELTRTKSLGTEKVGGGLEAIVQGGEVERNGEVGKVKIAPEDGENDISEAVYGKDGAMTWLVNLMLEYSMADEVFKWLATDHEFVTEVKQSGRMLSTGQQKNLYIIRTAVLGVMGAIVGKRLVVNPELRSSFARLWLPILLEISETIDGVYKIHGIELDSEERAIILFGFNELVLTIPAAEQQGIYSTWYLLTQKNENPEKESWFSLSGAYKRWLTRLGLPCSSVSFES